jgi:hypothetical protein
MPKKYMRCLRKVRAKGGVNPYAVCAPLRGKGHGRKGRGRKK